MIFLTFDLIAQIYLSMDDSPKSEETVQPEFANDSSVASPIAQEPQVGQPDIVPSEIGGESAPKIQEKVKHRLLSKILLSILVLFSIASVAVLLYYFFFVPRTKAEVFVGEMSRGFDLTLLDVQKLATKNANDKNSFEIARGSFFTIPSLRGGAQIEKDIAQDVSAIGVILSRIKSVKDQQSKLAAPLEVQDLNTKIDKYYLALTDAATALNDYENFQIKIIDAQGIEYNAELAKFGQIYNAGTKRPDSIAYFTKLIGLGDQSIKKLKALGEPPKDQINFYHYIVDSDVDRTDSLKKVLAGNGGPLSLGAMSDYLKRQEERDSNDIASTKALVESSLLRTSFDRVITQEDVTKEAFSAMKKKYGIAEPVGKQSQDATSSANP